MSATEILDQLKRAGVVAQVRSDGTLNLRPRPPADLLAQARACRDEIIALLTARMPEPDAPSTLCPDCNHNLWWRISATSQSAGPWLCGKCTAIDRTVWTDATAIPKPISTP